VISRYRSQIEKIRSARQQLQLSSRDTLDTLKPANRFIGGQTLRVAAAELRIISAYSILFFEMRQVYLPISRAM